MKTYQSKTGYVKCINGTYYEAKNELEKMCVRGPDWIAPR